MKIFFKYMLKPMAIISCIPSLGLLLYWGTHRKELLAISILLYFGVIIGNVTKYFYKDKTKI
ncbi:MAG: hypothetical protein ACREVX_03635 [Clostridium sp.]|uniref:hypothetical protein n=1 Tax=Clostridium sp. TaxID=1506 RepID=UPI003D6CBEE1